jgi:hypothetical protein
MTPNADYWDACEVALAGEPGSALHAYLEFTARPSTGSWCSILNL